MSYLTNIASTDGSGNYGSSVYDGASSSTSTTGTGSSSGSAAGGSVLTNTGFDILLAATLACVIIFAALIVKFWKQKEAQAALPD